MPPDESESSLPTQTAAPAILRSSPPSFSPEQSTENAMDDNQAQSFQPEPLGDSQKIQYQVQAPSATSTDSERPPSAQRANQNGNGEPPHVKDEEETEDELNPAAKIEDFDWDHLADRYHMAIKQCEQNEDELMQEWGNLMNVFIITSSTDSAGI
jgi:hypothetical protein